MNWADLISDTAAREFLLKGHLPAFRLVRADLVQLAAEIAGTDAEQIARALSAPDVRSAAVRCEVWCAPLGVKITVDEWLPGRG